MPDVKAVASKETTTKETSAAPVKPAAETGTISKAQDQAVATPKEVAPVDTSPAQVATDRPGTSRRLNFRKLVPVLVLLLAAGILLGITGGWNRLVGGSSTQK